MPASQLHTQARPSPCNPSNHTHTVCRPAHAAHARTHARVYAQRWHTPRPVCALHTVEVQSSLCVCATRCAGGRTAARCARSWRRRWRRCWGLKRRRTSSQWTRRSPPRRPRWGSRACARVCAARGGARAACHAGTPAAGAPCLREFQQPAPASQLPRAVFAGRIYGCSLGVAPAAPHAGHPRPGGQGQPRPCTLGGQWQWVHAAT